MKYKYVKLNEEPIEIECVPDEHEEENDFKPSFWFWNRRYFLENFIRVHNNPWLGTNAYDYYPEYIHGLQADEYYRPLFIELVDGRDEYVNVYEEKEIEDDAI